MKKSNYFISCILCIASMVMPKICFGKNCSSTSFRNELKEARSLLIHQRQLEMLELKMERLMLNRETLLDSSRQVQGSNLDPEVLYFIVPPALMTTGILARYMHKNTKWTLPFAKQNVRAFLDKSENHETNGFLSRLRFRIKSSEKLTAYLYSLSGGPISGFLAGTAFLELLAICGYQSYIDSQNQSDRAIGDKTGVYVRNYAKIVLRYNAEELAVEYDEVNDSIKKTAEAIVKETTEINNLKKTITLDSAVASCAS